jgi:hypothetical protein
MNCKTAVLLAALFCAQSPAQNDKLIEFPPLMSAITPSWLPAIPVIICGSAVSNLKISGPLRYSRFNGRPIAPLVIKVKVENVIQGDVSAGDLIDIYTFEYADSQGGTGRLHGIHVDERNIYLLLRDTRTLRLVCDGCEYGAPRVYSGPHPGFKRDESVPAAEQLAEILLTRGEGTTDAEMEHAIDRTGYSWLDSKVLIARLQILALRETPKVRESACSALKSWDVACPMSDDAGKIEPRK